MSSDAEIPCATCLFWNPEKKSFTCDPNKCKKLSNWLMKHTKVDTFVPKKKVAQYVV